jgi:hypothetical protein
MDAQVPQPSSIVITRSAVFLYRAVFTWRQKVYVLDLPGSSVHDIFVEIEFQYSGCSIDTIRRIG